MVKTTSILMLLIFIVSTCAGSQPTLTPTVLPPTSTQTPEPPLPTESPQIIFTPTATATDTPTETPTATPTETPKMTLDDWKEVFTGQLTAENGRVVNLNMMFNENIVNIYTSSDASQIEKLPMGTSFMILNPDGKIVFFADPSVAAERAREGAIIIVAKDGSVGGPDLAIKAAALQQEKGNKNVYVEFDEITGNDPRASGMRIYLKDIPNSSVVRMPKYFLVGHIYKAKLYTLEEAGINITDPKNWLDDVLKAGYTAIAVDPY